MTEQIDSFEKAMRDLVKRWPSTVVARHEVGRFSGGVLSPRTLANQDSQGTGPQGRLKVGRKVAYTVKSLVDYMRHKALNAETNRGC